MRTICAIRNNPARDIVEGVFKPRTVETVPMVVAGCLPAKVPFEYPAMAPAPAPVKSLPPRKLMAQALERMRTEKPDDFSTRDFCSGGSMGRVGASSLSVFFIRQCRDRVLRVSGVDPTDARSKLYSFVRKQSGGEQ